MSLQVEPGGGAFGDTDLNLTAAGLHRNGAVHGVGDGGVARGCLGAHGTAQLTDGQ
jgi:hypothetical protein